MAKFLWPAGDWINGVPLNIFQTYLQLFFIRKHFSNQTIHTNKEGILIYAFSFMNVAIEVQVYWKLL